MDVTLDDAPAGEAATVLAVAAEPVLGRRLAELGLRRGESVTPLHRTAGGGRLVALGDTRVALARAVLRTIEVQAP